MSLTQFGDGVGAVLGPWLLPGMKFDLVQAVCEIDTDDEAWGPVAPRTCTGALWLLVVVVVIGLNVLPGTAVVWLLSARSSVGVPTAKVNETTKQVQTSTDPGGNHCEFHGDDH